MSPSRVAGGERSRKPDATAAGGARKKEGLFVVFEWNAGRLGNQVRSLAYAVAVARLLNGSVVIPTPKPAQKSRPSVSAIGLEPHPSDSTPGLFDTARLRAGLPIAFASDPGVLEALAQRTRCRFLELYEHLKRGAKWKDYAHEPRGPELAAEVAKRRCGALDLEGSTQTLPPFSVPVCAWFQRDLDLQLLYRHLLPAPWIQTLVEERARGVRWASPLVAMHFRNQAQGSPNSTVCIEWVSWHLAHSNFSDHLSQTMANVTCTMDPGAIAEAWRLHGVPHDFDRVDGHWLLASDRSECRKAFANDVRLFNAELCPARWLLKDRHNATWVNISDMALPADTLHTSYTRYAEAIPEMWALSRADFFFGTLQSSLSDLVCGWRWARGEKHARASNMCWAYHLNNIIPGPRAVSGCKL